MLRVAEAAEIQLVFVRAKRRRDLDPAAPTELASYIEALEAYLAEHGTPLLDFSGDTRLGAEHFAHGDHLNVAGRALFTELLAEALEPHLDARRGT
jgi:lysophospholipase L1-like esterase